MPHARIGPSHSKAPDPPTRLILAAYSCPKERARPDSNGGPAGSKPDGRGGDGFLCCQSSGFDSCRLTSNPRLRTGRSRVGGEQDGPQPTRRRRRQHMHHAGRCPVPTDSRLFPLDQTKRERHNSLNLNGSEGCVARCPTVPAVFRVAPMARGLRATDAAQAEPGRWCPPGGQFMPVFARYCPVTGEISSGFSQRARGSSPPPRIGFLSGIFLLGSTSAILGSTC